MSRLCSMASTIAPPHSLPAVTSRGAIQHRQRLASSAAQTASAAFLSECE
jgi:hypothetical protein